jgi:MFS family permease
MIKKLPQKVAAAIISLAIIAPTPHVAQAMVKANLRVTPTGVNVPRVGTLGVGSQPNLQISNTLGGVTLNGSLPSMTLPAAAAPSLQNQAAVTAPGEVASTAQAATIKQAVVSPQTENDVVSGAVSAHPTAAQVEGRQQAVKSSKKSGTHVLSTLKTEAAALGKVRGATQGSRLQQFFAGAKTRAATAFAHEDEVDGEGAAENADFKNTPADSGLQKASSADAGKDATGDESVAAPTTGTSESNKGKFWTGAIISLIAGLGIAQIATEFLGQSMPQLIKESFGDFSVYASVMFFSLIGRTLGNAAGGFLPDKFGLKRTFLGAEIGRAVTLGLLVTALITGSATLPMYFGLMVINGFFTGVTLTAEHSMPRVMLGDNQRMLEKFYGMYQWILEFAGIGAPLVAGYIIATTGTFAWTLGAYPIVLAVAILFFAVMLKHPALGKPAPGKTYDGQPSKPAPPAVWSKRYTNILRAGIAAAVVTGAIWSGVIPFLAVGGILSYLSMAIGGILLTIAGLRAWAARRTKAGKTTGFLYAVDSGLGEMLGNFTEGAGIALKTPALRTAVLAEGGFIAMNGFLYALIAPAYGLYIMGSATMAPSVQAFMVGMYSLGSMLGALLMLRMNKKIEKKVEAGKASKSQEDAWMRRSTLRWMTAGALAITAFLPLVIGISAPSSFLFGITGLWTAIIPIYAAMLLFGVVSVVPTIKLKSLAARLTPSDSVPKVMGFIQLMSSMLIAFSVFGMSNIFDMFVDANDVPTQTAFWVMNGVLMLVAVGLLIARFFLGRQLKTVPLAEDEKEASADEAPKE